MAAVCRVAVMKTAIPRIKYSKAKKLSFATASLRELLVKVPRILPNNMIVAGCEIEGGKLLEKERHIRWTGR
jgi:hypothetical protein